MTVVGKNSSYSPVFFMANTKNGIPDINFWYFYYGKSDIFRRKLPKGYR